MNDMVVPNSLLRGSEIPNIKTCNLRCIPITLQYTFQNRDKSMKSNSDQLVIIYNLLNDTTSPFFASSAFVYILEHLSGNFLRKSRSS